MPGVLCEHCTGLCCRYIALPIDEPKTREDFDDLRWYMLHAGVTLFVEDGDWYLSVETTCRHLQPDHRCGIYATRPRVCREYSTDTCEYHPGDYGYERHFLAPENLADYQRQALAGRRRRRTRRARGGLRVRLGVPRRAAAAGRSAAPRDGRGVPLPVLGAWP